MRQVCKNCARWIHQDDAGDWVHDSHDQTRWCANGQLATPTEETT